MREGNLTSNFWEAYYPTAIFFYLLLHHVFLHRGNISVNKLICQRSHLNDQLMSLTEYALYYPSPHVTPGCRRFGEDKKLHHHTQEAGPVSKLYASCLFFFSSYLICSAVTAPGQMGWPRCTHTCRLHFPHGKAEEAGGGGGGGVV
jgi:hypothetical protein